MSLLCRIRGHDPDPDEICNGGHCFTRCRRCGSDLVKEGEAWQPVPAGFRVVWTDRETPPSAAPDAQTAPPAQAPPAPSPPPKRSAERAPAPASPGAYVLVCDDDPLVTDLLAHRLAGRGYRVSVAVDGREALALLAQERPDAIVLDAMMPVHDGYEVLRRIRAEERLAGIPVIMLTARKQESDIVGALELGASDFVVKPFIPEELLSRLARLIAARD